MSNNKEITRKKVALRDWIRENTEDVSTVIELGAGFFDKLAFVHSNVEKKIGIEIWDAYVADAKYDDCIKIIGDARKFDELVRVEDMDCCLLVDIIEHFTLESATNLLEKIKKHFNKIVLMVPEGFHPQTQDVLGYGAHYYQTHRSVWYAESLIDLGFRNIIIDGTFHGSSAKDKGCIFAIWRKG